tara:strand:- start:94 stop:2130 length:2037 start_codon:yes stop_codon:yes gene_type:complete
LTDRNVLKSRNLEIFKIGAPVLFQKLIDYSPLSKLTINGEGKENIHFNDNRLYQECADDHAREQLALFWVSPSRIFLQPPHTHRVDGHTERFIRDLLRRSRDEGIEFFETPSSSESYFLTIFGIGLGKHIDELVEKTNCQVLLLADISLELLYHSLETYDWRKLFESFHENDRIVQILIDEVPENLCGSIMMMLRTINPCSVDGFTFFTHYDSPAFSKAISLLNSEAFLVLSGMGHLFDEVLMMKNAHGNLFSGESRVYFRPEERLRDVPAFVVASGPSLDKDIQFIKDNSERAIIISCGSALRPLMVNGVVPDFQIEIENIHVLPIIAQVAEEHDVSPVCLIAASTVENGVEQYFNNVIYYFRNSLSPFHIFCDSERYCLKYPSPIVLNGGLSFAQEVGFRNIYFFGTDLGVKNPEKHHSKDTYHYTAENPILDEQVCDIPFQGNIGGQCFTSMAFRWSLNFLINAIKEFQNSRCYFNCSDGILIDGAQPQPANSLSFPKFEGGKNRVAEKIVENFPVYTKKKFHSAWSDQRIGEEIGKFIDSIEECFSETSSYLEKKYLKNLMKLLPPNPDNTRISPNPYVDAMATTFRGTVYMLTLILEYYLKRVAEPEMAKRLEAIAREEFAARLGYIRRKALEELGNISELAERGILPASVNLDDAFEVNGGQSEEQPQIIFR